VQRSSGTDAGNYDLTSVSTTTANITAFEVTGSFTADNKIYDATDAATVLTRSPGAIFSGDDVSLTGGTATFDDKNVGTGKTVTLTGATLSGTDAGNYDLTSVSTTTANITAFEVTGSFTADNKIYDATDAATVLTRSPGAIFSGDDVSLIGGTATFDDKNVGTGKTVTLNGATLSGTDAGNYDLTSVSTTTANITAFEVTGSFTADNKIYDATDAATVLTRSPGAIFSGDDVTLTGGTATFDDKNVGTGKTVTLSGATLSGTDAGNYDLTSVSTTTANITAFEVTGSFTADNKIYDATDAATVLTRSPGAIFSGDDVTLTGGTATFDDKNAGTGKTVTLSGATLSGADAGNYDLTSVSTTTANITAFEVTGSFTADNKIYDATDAATVLTRSPGAIFSGDDVELTGGTATFDDKNAGTGKTVTLSGATLSGTDAGNYDLLSVSTTTANITAFEVTGSFTADNKIYDATDAATVLTRSPGAIFSGDDVTLTGGTATFDDKNAGTGKTVTLTGATLTGADAGNYDLTSVSTTTANITAFEVTGSFTADNKIYDATDAATVLTRSPGAIFSGDDVTLTGGTATFDDKNAGTGKTVTLSGATLTGADAGNYDLVSVSTTTANITAFEVTGSFTADNKIYDATDAATVLTRSPGAIFSGDDVTLTGGTATFDDKNVGTGKTVTLSGATLSGTDAGNYDLTSVSTTTANITAFEVTGSFTADNKIYDATDAATVLTRSPGAIFSGDDVSLTGGTATFDDKNVGTGKTVTLSGATLSGTDAGNYDLVSVSTTTANITAFEVTGSFTADNKIYDATDAATVLTRSPGAIFSGDDVTLTGGTATFDDKNVGTGKTVTLSGATLSGTDAGNYDLTSVSTTTANITAFEVTGSFTADNKIYDATDAATVLTRSPGAIFSGDDVSLTGGTATFDDKNVGTGKTVTLSGATLSGTDAGNYDLTSVSTTTANITAFEVTGSFTADNKIYDATDAATVLTRSPGAIFSGDDVSLIGGTATFDDKNAGTGKTVTLSGATLSGTDAGNYDLTSVSTTTANITAFEVTGSFTADNKVYDGNANASVLTRSPGSIFSGDVVTLTGGTASFNNKNVGTGKTVTLSGATLSGTDAGNYDLVSVSTTTANITTFDVTGSFTSDNKVYDGNANASVLTRSPGSIFSGDVITLTGGTASFNNKNVGTGKTVTLAGAALSGADAGNYNLVSVNTTTANITTFGVTGSFTADNKVYDANANASVLTRSPGSIFSGDVVTLTGGTASFNNKNVGTGKTVTLAGATLTGGDAGNYQLLSVSTTTANITAFEVTGSFTADNKVYDGNANAIVLTRSPGSIFSGDVVTLTGGTAIFNNKNVGINKPVSLSGATLAGGDAGNYLLISVANAQANITQKGLTVTGITANGKIYDGNTNVIGFTGTGVLSGKVSGDYVTLNGSPAGAFSSKNVGLRTVTVTGYTITGTDAGNYNFSQPIGLSGTISQKDLTVTGITPNDKVYNGNTTVSGFTGTGVLSGKITSDYVTLNGVPSGIFASKNVGNRAVAITGYSITGSDAGNYNFLQPSGLSANITPATLTYVANAVSRVYGNANGSLTGTVTGFVGTENQGTATTGTPVFATTVTVTTGVGNYPITGSGLTANYGNYTFVQHANNATAFGITKRSLNYTGTRMYNGTKSFGPELVLGNTVNGDVVTVSGSALVTEANVGTYIFFTDNGINLVPSNANYKPDGGTVNVSITPQTANPVGDAYYSGPSFYWTTSATSKTATLALSATIKNNQNYTGDVRTARISFFIRNGTTLTPISGAQNLPVGLVNPSDPGMGTAAVNLQYSVTTHTILQIAVKITGNYTGLSDEQYDGQVEIAIPTPGGLIAGSARLCNTNSTGYLKGATTCPTGPVKADVSFFVQYNKSLSNPQGKVYLTIRSYNDKNGNVTNYLHTYKVKSTAISVLATTSPNAQFSGKANVSEIVNGTEVNIEGGAQMQLSLYDGQAPGQNNQADKFGITIFRNSGGVWYSNNWIGNKTEDATLCGGDVSVTGNGTNQVISSPSIVDEDTRLPENGLADGMFKVKAYPNPSTHYFTLDVQSNSNEPIELKVYDMTGHMVYYHKGSLKEAHHRFGQMLTNGTYILEVRQGTERSSIPLLKK
jgi:uncharacterized protein YjbI with pentapeptide repeats